MSLLTITTPFNIDIEFKLAPFHKRILATFIDYLIIYVYVLVVLKVLDIAGLKDHVLQSAFILLVSIPAFLYNFLCEVFFNGQSLGKKITGLKVMDKEGNEPTLSQYLIRFLLSIGNYFVLAMPLLLFSSGLMIIIIIYLPDILCIAVSKKSQRLGDLAAGTVLIDQRARTSIHETIYLDIEDQNYEAKYPEVMRLSDRDINGIRNLLAMKTGSRDVEAYMVDVAHRIKEVLKVESDLHAKDFLQQLLQDYNALTRK